MLKYKYEIYSYLLLAFQAGRFHANPANIAVKGIHKHRPGLSD
jgi:hypothetical protein